MASGTGIRLNGALSILLVVLLVLGGMASMTSLEMDDTAATDNSGNTNEKAASDSTSLKSDDAWIERCNNLDDGIPTDRNLGEWDLSTSIRERNTAAGRQANEPDNSSDNTTEVDWHLPDHISVSRTDSGYVVSIIDANGVTTTTNYSRENFSSFLEEHGWAPHNDSTHDNESRDRGDLREMIGNLREACESGDDESCRELRVLMERLRNSHGERGEREEAPEISLELLEDGTIIAHREFSDGHLEYDIISTSEKGEKTIVRVTPWSTDIIYPQPAQNHRGDGDWMRGEMGGNELLIDFAGEMNEEDFRVKCQQLLLKNDKPLDINFIDFERAPMERHSDRDE
jgi:hypothetical protein